MLNEHKKFIKKYGDALKTEARVIIAAAKDIRRRYYLAFVKNDGKEELIKQLSDKINKLLMSGLVNAKP